MLIFQHNYLNKMLAEELYTDVIIIPLSSQTKESDFTLQLPQRDRLEKKSTLLCNAIKMIHAKRLMLEDGVLTTLSADEMKDVEARVLSVLGF